MFEKDEEPTTKYALDTYRGIEIKIRSHVPKLLREIEARAQLSLPILQHISEV